MSQDAALPILSIKQAAKATGRSRPTILRAIQSGKISAVRHEVTRAWQIQPAELHRIYPPATAHNAHTNDQDGGKTEDAQAILRHELALMTAERERERRLMQDTIDDLRRRLDAEAQERRREAEERRRLTALLTEQQPRPAPPAAPQRGFWARLTGRT